MLAKVERHKEAVQCYDMAMKSNDYEREALTWKGVSLAKLERYEEAIKCYDVAIEIEPDSAFTYSTREF